MALVNTKKEKKENRYRLVYYQLPFIGSVWQVEGDGHGTK